MQVAMKGTRLAYVVVPIEGTVKRIKHLIEPRKVKNIIGEEKVVYERSTKLVEEPGGYMVYFPKGHAIRLKDKAALAHYNLDGEPRMINLTGLEDPNSPAGKLLRAQDDASRGNVMNQMENYVIQLATAKSGKEILTRVEKEAA